MAVKKVTVNLPEEMVDFLLQVAKEHDMSFTDALRQAIKSEQFFVAQEKAQNKILIEEPSGRMYLVFRR